MALEIICAGFGRTGTLSLKTALERLGFGPCHHMIDVINDEGQLRLWADVASGRPDFVTIFQDFRSAVDFPVAACWQEVLAVTPGAKVILSDRDSDDWYASFSQTVLPLLLEKPISPDTRQAWMKKIDEMIIEKALGGRTDREGILAAYRANADAVRALEAEGRAIVFRSGDGWVPLCDFLGVEVPDEPYPKTNARANFLAAGGAAP